MSQLSFWDDVSTDRIVNVASVPQRSPFRYPGGKTWLVPRIRQWLVRMSHRPHLFVEPFAGGGIVSLTVAFERLCETVLMVELDDQVAAVWRTVLEGDAEWLAERIEEFELSYEAVRSVLGNGSPSLREKAFQTLLKNRVFHGGILAPGSSVMKHGENGKGIGSRWYPRTLAKRIREIAMIGDRVHFIEGDGMQVLREHASDDRAAFFIDPPYTAAGKKAGTRLYAHNVIDHEELFGIAETLTGDFLMTYDHNEEVLRMAERHGFDIHAIPMKNTHNARMTELLIGRNLDWTRT